MNKEEFFRKLNGVDMADGNLSDLDAEAFIKVAKMVAKDNCKFLDIGPWKGKSTICLAAVASKYDGTVYALDHWQGTVGTKCEINGTFFSHPRAAAGFTLASKDPGVRAFWIEHAKRTREVGAHLGRAQGSACINNLWIPDGLKDHPADRLGYRDLLARSLDGYSPLPSPRAS